jgi:hypothetical protein
MSRTLIVGVLALGILLGGVFLIVLFLGLDVPSVEQGGKNAEPILQSLEFYKQDNGKYPTTIDLLTPKYLTVLPRAGWRIGFEYEACGADFVLVFRGGPAMLCGYTNKSAKWDCFEPYTGIPASASRHTTYCKIWYLYSK